MSPPGGGIVVLNVSLQTLPFPLYLRKIAMNTPRSLVFWGFFGLSLLSNLIKFLQKLGFGQNTI